MVVKTFGKVHSLLHYRGLVLTSTNEAMTVTLKPVPLTSAAFASFGDVIEATSACEQRSINEGNTTRFHNLSKLVLDSDDGEPSINIFRSTPLGLPLTLTTLERHPLSSQAFFPLSTNQYLVVVAPPGELDIKQIVAFLAEPNQGINYRPGTWHHYSLALDEISDFLVVDRIGPRVDYDEANLPEDLLINLE